MNIDTKNALRLQQMIHECVRTLDELKISDVNCAKSLINAMNVLNDWIPMEYLLTNKEFKKECNKKTEN
jgi:hypothetical protein